MECFLVCKWLWIDFWLNFKCKDLKSVDDTNNVINFEIKVPLGDNLFIQHYKSFFKYLLTSVSFIAAKCTSMLMFFKSARDLINVFKYWFMIAVSHFQMFTTLDTTDICQVTWQKWQETSLDSSEPSQWHIYTYSIYISSISREFEKKLNFKDFKIKNFF